MTDGNKRNVHQQEQGITNDDNISSLIEQISEQLVCIMVFYYGEYPWNRTSASILDWMMFSLYIRFPLGLTILLRNLLESKKFQQRKTNTRGFFSKLI